MLRSSFIILLVFCGICLNARDIYIAPGGSDRNPGTREQPLASLTGARDLIRELRSRQQLNEAVHVVVTDGRYYMTESLVLSPEDSGSEAFPVVYRADAGARPVFTGGFAITGWEKISDHIWRAKVPEVSRYGCRFEQLYVDGHRAVRAKTPNSGFYFLRGVAETVVSRGNGRVPEVAVQKLSLFQPANEVLKQLTKQEQDLVVMTLYHKWDNTRKPIMALDADSSCLYLAGEGMKPWNSLDKQTRFTLENFRAALDTTGEWYLDKKGDLFYFPPDGKDPNLMTFHAPIADRLITLEGDEQSGAKVQYIRFENLRFEVTGYRMPLWGNEPAQAASPVEAAVQADYAAHIDWVNCEISQTGANAIWLRKACTDCTVQHCYLHDLGAGGIKIGDLRIPENEKDLTQRITADNNIIRSGGYVFPCAVGVTIFQSSDNRVTHNEIADFRYSGVSVGWVWGYSYSPAKRNIIEFNHIHHLGWGELCDMGGVYCLGMSEGTSVSNNVIHHVYSFDYGGWGLYTDEGSTGIVMENNLVYACKNSGFHQHYGKENIIHNNIFAANIRAQLQATRVEEHLSFTFSNNIVWFNSGTLLSSRWSQVRLASDRNNYWDARTGDVRFDKATLKEWQAAGKDRNSVVADPQFTDPGSFDFRIKNKALIKKIGFKPFDYSQAGVYGDENWKKLAAFDAAVAEQFNETIRAHEDRMVVKKE